MLQSLKKIFETNTIEINANGDTIPLHSNTSLKQGYFLQQMFDLVKPEKSIEVGFAYGISSMFILEKHRELQSKAGAHIVIEPDIYWGGAAEFNINKEGLLHYLDVRRDFSDKVLAKLFLENVRLQYAYIDTTKKFDAIMQDFYMINKMMDNGGVVILDDCGGSCPGVQRVARFINTLPNFKVLGAFEKNRISFKKQVATRIVTLIMGLLPFKNKIYEGIDFSTNAQLGLDFSCIAFIKHAEDKRKWNWDEPL